jgi:hypothetical protein
MIPRFTLVTSSFPKLRKGEESIVYQALTQHPQSQSLEKVVEQCRALGYEQLMKRSPALSDVWESVLWHLNRMRNAGIVKEE